MARFESTPHSANNADDPRPDCDLKWYAVRLRSNFEQVAARALEARGYEVFLPTYSSRKTVAGRDVLREVPVFPGYLFSRFDLQRRQGVVTTPGLVHVVGIGRQPIPVPDPEIESLMRLTLSADGVRPCPFLQTGDVVRITSGALTGVEGLLLQSSGGPRLVLSISLLQRSVSAEVDAECVEFVRRGPRSETLDRRRRCA